MREHFEDISDCPACDPSVPLSHDDEILIGYYEQLTIWSLGGAGGVGESVVVGAGTRGAARGGALFGQASVISVFAHGPHAGRTIGEVAQGLRAGTISPNSLPVGYVVRNGQAIALNNRSLLALRRAGMQP